MHDWLIGENGVYSGAPGKQWTRKGKFDYKVNALLRRDADIVAGVNCGVWLIDPASGRWKQLHDETVTEVLALASSTGDAGVVIGCPYGFALPEKEENGALIWRFENDGLSVNERFVNALVRIDTDTGIPGGDDDYLVGTEAGVLIARETGERWERTSLTGRPVRALLQVDDRLWAGTDCGGIWTSRDGLSWELAGLGFDDGTALSLCSAGDAIVAGTDRGVVIGGDRSHWRRYGPQAVFRSIAGDYAMADGAGNALGSGRRGGEGEYTILAGSQPAGLWRSDDGGIEWRQEGEFSGVGIIVGPKTEQHR